MPRTLLPVCYLCGGRIDIDEEGPYWWRPESPEDEPSMQDADSVPQGTFCCDADNQPPADSDREPDDNPWDDQRDDRIKQALGEPNYSEAEPAGLDDPMSWER